MYVLLSTNTCAPFRCTDAYSYLYSSKKRLWLAGERKYRYCVFSEQHNCCFRPLVMEQLFVTDFLISVGGGLGVFVPKYVNANSLRFFRGC